MTRYGRNKSDTKLGATEMIAEYQVKRHGGDSLPLIFKMLSPPRPPPGPPGPPTIATKDVGVVPREIALHTSDVSLLRDC